MPVYAGGIRGTVPRTLSTLSNSLNSLELELEIRLEDAGRAVEFDCNFPDTMTGMSSLAKRDALFKANAFSHNHFAQGAFVTSPLAEINAHAFSNPLYVPIWNDIPTP